MEKKKIIIIGVIILIIAAVVITVMMTSTNYERIEITPNGTTIEVPAGETSYKGKIQSVKIWNWNEGILISYNSAEDDNSIKIAEMGLDAVKDLIKSGENQTIEGFTIYVLNADNLTKIPVPDFIKIDNNKELYCILLSNETTHDNILIGCNNKDIAVHMAQSVEYKNVYPEKLTKSNSTYSSDDLIRKANDYINNTNLDDIQSTIEGLTH